MYMLFTQFCVVATLLQFKRLANVYFLVTAVLQFIPAISPLSPVSAIAPLIFVLTVSLIRAAVEQVGKFRYDRQANSNKFLVYTERQVKNETQQPSGENSVKAYWQQVRSDELRIGNIIKINKNQRFPADIIILSTSSIDGKAYIETSSLDGEKNLKIKSILPSTKKMYSSLQEIAKTNEKKPFFTIQEPSQQLYSFNAMLQYTVEKPIQGMKSKKQQKASQFVKINQFLYRESVLRNTEYIVGVIAYVGKYTKSMMNSTRGHNKMSKLERKVNFYMIFIFLLQLVLIILCGLLRVFLFYDTNYEISFSTLVLLKAQKSSMIEGAITSSSYFILLNTMIPISLLVSIEIVKFGQGIFISYDKLMSKQDQKDGKTINSRAFRSSINQQLGMVEYVFTDKTGTLTKNQMLLKQVIVENIRYENEESGPKKNCKAHYFNSKLQENSAKTLPQFEQVMKELRRKIQWQLKPQEKQSVVMERDKKLMNTLMMIIMSACHECLLVKGETEESQQYHGSSPDEITLVQSSARCGYKFLCNQHDKISIQLGDGNIIQLKVEDTFQFNSDRKRMSFIISTSHLPNYVLVLSKGADSMMDKLLREEYKSKNESPAYHLYGRTKQKINQYSKIGLRTLVFGYKAIPINKYLELKQKLKEYSGIYTNKQPAKSRKQEIVFCLEEKLNLCGATAVEDKLQDEVQQVIHDLIKANVKVCMLTGDKLETAENIARSCSLFRQEWKIIHIAEGSGDVDVFKGYCQVKDCVEMGEKYGILIEGSAISTAVQSVYFAQMFDHCSAAVCCRITPGV